MHASVDAPGRGAGILLALGIGDSDALGGGGGCHPLLSGNYTSRCVAKIGKTTILSASAAAAVAGVGGPRRWSLSASSCGRPGVVLPPFPIVVAPKSGESMPNTEALFCV